VRCTLNGLELTLDGETGGLIGMRHPGVATLLRAPSESAGLVDVADPIEDVEPLRHETRFWRGADIRVERDRDPVFCSRLGASPGGFDLKGRGESRVSFTAAPDGRSVALRCEVRKESSRPERQVGFSDLNGLPPFAGEEGTSLIQGEGHTPPWRRAHPGEGPTKVPPGGAPCQDPRNRENSWSCRDEV
jgi:hypothetical protein